MITKTNLGFYQTVESTPRIADIETGKAGIEYYKGFGLEEEDLKEKETVHNKFSQLFVEHEKRACQSVSMGRESILRAITKNSNKNKRNKSKRTREEWFKLLLFCFCSLCGTKTV